MARIFLQIIVALSITWLSRGAIPDPTYDEHWVKFKDTHKKTYSHSQEEIIRRCVFEQHLRHVMEHNAKYDAGLVSYAKSVNHPLSDLTYEEVKSAYLGASSPSRVVTSGVIRDFSRPLLNRTSYIDWTSTRVTLVKDQGHRSSGWAFAAIGAIEGQLATVNKPLTNLSEGQLLDCVLPENNNFKAGDSYAAYEDVIQRGGIETEMTYPYKVEARCKFNKSNVYVSLKSYSLVVPAGDEDALANAVVSQGPMSVYLHVDSNFVNYKSGIFDEPNCTVANEKSSNKYHAMLLVGYGTDNGLDFWLIKNSWGTRWGEKGYMRVKRNAGNMCSVASYASYPNL